MQNLHQNEMTIQKITKIIFQPLYTHEICFISYNQICYENTQQKKKLQNFFIALIHIHTISTFHLIITKALVGG